MKFNGCSSTLITPKKGLAIRATILICISCCCLNQVFAQATLKVMTFNIRYNNPSDSIFNWDHRKSMVYEVFRESSPDLAGLQEVLNSQVKDLKAALKDYSVFGVGRDDGQEKGEYSLVMYRKSRFKLLDGSTFWLSSTPSVPGSKSWNTACTRIVTWVKLKDKNTGESFFVFNTHFDHQSEQARTGSARLLKRKISEICGENLVFITGDFNSTSRDTAYQILTGKDSPGPLRDARLQAPGSRTEPDYTFVGFPFNPAPGNQIDFIFTLNGSIIKVQDYRIITYNRGGYYPSDHLPVMATFGSDKPK